MTRNGQDVEDWLRRLKCLYENRDLRLWADAREVGEEFRNGCDDDILSAMQAAQTSSSLLLLTNSVRSHYRCRRSDPAVVRTHQK